MGAEIISGSGMAFGGGPFIRHLQLRVGELFYLIRITEQGWGPSRRREARFLGYKVDGELHQFTHIPYEGTSFAWAARHFFTDDTTVILDIAGEESLPVSQEELQEVDTASIVGPVWCPVANMTERRPVGPGGIDFRRGSKHFAANAKLYCYPALWGDGYEQIQVIGRHRGSHRYVRMIVSSSWLVNWRVKLIYSPHLIRELWPFWNGTEIAKAQAQRLVDGMLRRPNNAPVDEQDNE